jgi:hypothetical protein
MKKDIWLIISALAIIVLGILVYLGNLNRTAAPGSAPGTMPAATPGTDTTSSPAAFDPLNATYIIEGQPVMLVNGQATTPAASSSALPTVTMVFGKPTIGDLNGDGQNDAAMILVQNPGGSGTFFYVAAAINTTSGTQGTNAIFLGDRIALQNVEIANEQVIANYADRKPGQPMSTKPSVGISKYFTVANDTLQPANAIVGAGEHCGGNMTTAPTCATGYHCAPTPGSHLPFGDVGGICMAN